VSTKEVGVLKEKLEVSTKEVGVLKEKLEVSTKETAAVTKEFTEYRQTKEKESGQSDALGFVDFLKYPVKGAYGTLKHIVKEIDAAAGYYCDKCESWQSGSHICWGPPEPDPFPEPIIKLPEPDPFKLPKSDPGANGQYSVTCGYGCGTTRWTNNYDEYMRWQSDSYCFMYGSQ
jgi:hypothetical protein